MTQLVPKISSATRQSYPDAVNAIEAAIATANAHIQANPSLFPGNRNVTVNVSPTSAAYAGLYSRGQVYLNPAVNLPAGEFSGVLAHELAHALFQNDISKPTIVTTATPNGSTQQLNLHNLVDSAPLLTNSASFEPTNCSWSWASNGTCRALPDPFIQLWRQR